jgi:GMP synthase-like glutamine amidotransferase
VNLLVDLCYEKDSLSKHEFVLPIEEIVKQAGVKCDIIHYTEISEKKIEKYERAVLCGTALKDNAYNKNLDAFSWILDWTKPVLGICAGMQVIASLSGGSILAKPIIGFESIKIIRKSSLLGEPRQIEVYHLHKYGVTLPQGFDLVGGTIDNVEAFMHLEKQLYGIMFHPEVRNRWILERFIQI